MLSARVPSFMASLALTAGLLGVLILTLAPRVGLSGPAYTAPLHAFTVAPEAEPPGSPAAYAPAPPKLPAQRPSQHGAKVVPAPAPDTSQHSANAPIDRIADPFPNTPAANAANGLRHAADATVLHPQPLAASDFPAAPSRAETNAYSSMVLAWIKRHQRFPESHVRNALDATVLIAFTIDRRGRADHVRVVRGSGLSWLDALAVRQVRGASPFPRPLKSAPAEVLSFEVPMRYRAGS